MKKKLFFFILSCLILTCFSTINLTAQITCGEFTITPGSGTILIEGTSGVVYPKFEIVDQVTWTPVVACTDCNDYTITGLADGQYQIKAFDVNWSPCTTAWFQVTNSGSSGTDADGDGVTVEDGDCNDSDPNLTTIGASCDDGNSSTTGDVVQSNCTCLGSSGGGTDADGDGVTVEDGDCDDADPNLTTYGAPCDDGNSGTISDIVDGNCNCQGYLKFNSPFTGLTVEESCDNKGTVLKTDDILTLSFNPQGTNLSSVYNITDGSNNLIADNIPYGTPYQVDIPQSTSNYTIQIRDGAFINPPGAHNYILYSYPNSRINPEIFGQVGCPCTDNDSDGVCDDVDCDPNDSNITTMIQPVGTTCDDGDPNTENDVIQSNGCDCAGTPIDNGGGNTSNLWSERTTAPFGIFTTERTMVEDTLTAEKIIVQTDVYADYVFEKNYPLLSLLQLEQYIQQNHHLPNIPPAAEIVSKGIDVSEMSVKHMEKIEELTLYLLQMNKRLEQLEKENEQLKETIKKGSE